MLKLLSGTNQHIIPYCSTNQFFTGTVARSIFFIQNCTLIDVDPLDRWCWQICRRISVLLFIPSLENSVVSPGKKLAFMWNTGEKPPKSLKYFLFLYYVFVLRLVYLCTSSLVFALVSHLHALRVFLFSLHLQRWFCSREILDLVSYLINQFHAFYPCEGSIDTKWTCKGIPGWRVRSARF